MCKESHVSLFSRFYQEASMCADFSRTEKFFFVCYSKYFNIDLSKIEFSSTAKLGASKLEEANLRASLLFLYNMHLVVIHNFTLDDYFESVLKKYAIKLGFLDSYLTELSTFLTECAYLKIPFDDVFESLSF